MVNHINKEPGYLSCPVNIKSMSCIYYPKLRCVEIDEPSVDMDKPCINVKTNSYTHKSGIKHCVNYILWWKENGFD